MLLLTCLNNFHISISPSCIFNALVKYSAPLLKTMDSNKKSIVKNDCRQFKDLKKNQSETRMKKGLYSTGFGKISALA